jgi:hypothetical protein
VAGSGPGHSPTNGGSQENSTDYREPRPPRCRRLATGGVTTSRREPPRSTRAPVLKPARALLGDLLSRIALGAGNRLFPNSSPYASPTVATRTSLTVLLRASVPLRQGIGSPGLVVLALPDHHGRLAVSEEAVLDTQRGDPEVRSPELSHAKAAAAPISGFHGRDTWMRRPAWRIIQALGRAVPPGNSLCCLWRKPHNPANVHVAKALESPWG